ncbi:MULTISPECIES: hypothetical protein [Paenibacillus]|uniref:hypothetical protein n=1 Tax=Paenibacillus TaxID=44249 RepID=UPI002FE11EC6
MKKLTALTASVLLTAAFATGVSADPATTSTNENTNTAPTVVGQTVEGTVTTSEGTSVTNSTYVDLDEPIITPDEIIIAPEPITLTKVTYFYETPGGKTLSALAPQTVNPTGQTSNNWVEIYTWLGKAWIYRPGYTPTY